MEIFSTNPLKTLSLQELNTFMMAIKSNFRVVKVKEDVMEDLHTRWFDLHTNCLRYVYMNHENITKEYPKMEDRTNDDVIEIMIIQELNEKMV
jgi:hypothetical protein